MANANPNILIQIFFGRYRDWGNIQWAHLIILGSAVTLMIQGYMYLLRNRLYSYAEEKEAMRQRKTIPITQRDLGRTMFVALINEMVKVNGILDDKVAPERNGPESGDPGWGTEKHVQNVHFNTSIAKSFHVLEKAASSRRPGLKHRDSRSIRDYIAALRKAFPSISQQLCDEYTNTYERAVFSSHRFTHPEYDRFVRVTLNIVALIKS